MAANQKSKLGIDRGMFIKRVAGIGLTAGVAAAVASALFVSYKLQLRHLFRVRAESRMPLY